MQTGLFSGSIIPPDIRRILDRCASGLPVTNAENQLADEWCEDLLACHGRAVVSRASYQIVERFEAGLPVTLNELESVLYEIYSGPFGEYFPRSRCSHEKRSAIPALRRSLMSSPA
jgi:hypothetical protein